MAAQNPAPLDVTAMQMATAPPAERRGRPLSGVNSPDKKFTQIFPLPTFLTRLAELDKRASEQNQGEFLAEIRHCLHCISDQFATWQVEFGNHASGLETHHRALHSASLAVATIVAAAKNTQEEVHKIQGSLFNYDRQADVREQKLDRPSTSSDLVASRGSRAEAPKARPTHDLRSPGPRPTNPGQGG